jgi:hypothetical protein
MACALHNFKNSQIEGHISMIYHSPICTFPSQIVGFFMENVEPVAHYSSGFLTILLGPPPTNLEIPTRISKC